jgi:hypothetical protein
MTSGVGAEREMAETRSSLTTETASSRSCVVVYRSSEFHAGDSMLRSGYVVRLVAEQDAWGGKRRDIVTEKSSAPSSRRNAGVVAVVWRALLLFRLVCVCLSAGDGVNRGESRD